MSFSFSDRALQRVSWLRTRYPTDRALILPVLHMAQRENGGWVSPEVIKSVAELIPVPEMWVKEVATFYTMFNREPVGKYFIQLCGTTPCMICGSEEIKQVHTMFFVDFVGHPPPTPLIKPGASLH